MLNRLATLAPPAGVLAEAVAVFEDEAPLHLAAALAQIDLDGWRVRRWTSWCAPTCWLRAIRSGSATLCCGPRCTGGSRQRRRAADAPAGGSAAHRLRRRPGAGVRAPAAAPAER